jgi:hypothetical protein
MLPFKKLETHDLYDAQANFIAQSKMCVLIINLTLSYDFF